MIQSSNFFKIRQELNRYELKNAPSEIYYRGNIELLNSGRRVSVVGSRDVSEHGIERAKQVTKELVKNDIIVVSGLARGVDTVAHTTALEEGGFTIAVLGTGLQNISPKSNSELFERIIKNNLAISEFPNGTPGYKQNFPKRNRTMALISDATIIIEAGETSGTIHQGWESIRLGRQLFILENIVNNSKLSWPKKMIEYGAQVLSKENGTWVDKISNVPFLTQRIELTY